MGNSYCFMHIEKIKTAAAFSRKQAHNLREGFVPNADISRTFLNEELIKPKGNKSFNQFYRDKIKESSFYRNHKPRKDAVRGLEIMFSYTSPKKGESMPPEFSLEEWKKQNIEWLKETFGEDNIASVVLHMDEATPHIHAIVVPMVNERLNASHYIEKKKDFSHLQDTYAEKMKTIGLQRGLRYSSAKHTDIRKFYADLNDVVKKVLPPVKEKETAEQYRERANEIYQAANMMHFQETKEYERKLTEHNTYDLQEIIEFEKQKEEFEKERERFEYERSLFEEEHNATPEDAREGLWGLYQLQRAMETYSDQEYADAVLAGLEEIQRYYEEKAKEKDLEKRKQIKLEFDKKNKRIKVREQEEKRS